MLNYLQPYIPAYRFLTQAKYRMDFLRNCFRSFGVYRSWHLYKLLRQPQSNGDRTIHIPAEIAGAPLLLRHSKSDIDAFYKIFAWKEYHLPPDFLPKSVNSIVDLGANIGLSVFYFASRFPQARIIGLEPDLENFKLLEANTKNFGHLDLVNGGIWNRRASLKIENPHARPDSYRLCECTPGTPGSVSAFSIPDLLETHRMREIDILKADIEGAEVQLFSDGCEAWLPKVHTLIIELHGEKTREQLVPKISRFFSCHFRRCENDVFVR
jgi:FkbM family methyltransferase